MSITPNITTENVIEYHINNKNSYEMFTASLKDFDGEEIRDKLKIKIKNNQKFTEQDKQSQEQSGGGSGEDSQEEEKQQDVGHDTHSMWEQAVKKLLMILDILVILKKK